MAKTRIERSKNYQKVSNYYLYKLWSLDRVHNAVGKWITEEEYQEITGYAYPNKRIEL